MLCELTSAELNLVVLGQLAGCVSTGPSTSTLAGHTENEQAMSYSSFTHQAKPVCCTTFRSIHGIGEKQLKNNYNTKLEGKWIGSSNSR